MFHHIRNVVERRMAVHLVLGRLEQWPAIGRIARDDVVRLYHPQRNAFLPPRVGVPRMGQRELWVRSMNAANVAMRHAAKERMKDRRDAWNDGAWVRDAAAAYEAKRTARAAA